MFRDLCLFRKRLLEPASCLGSGFRRGRIPKYLDMSFAVLDAESRTFDHQ
jgi:hypothetical protein